MDKGIILKPNRTTHINKCGSILLCLILGVAEQSYNPYKQPVTSTFMV